MLNNKLNNYYNKNKEEYLEKSSKEVGIWVVSHETHPDTGAILADTSYCSNEDEVESYAKDIFINELINGDISSDDIFEFTEEDRNSLLEILND